MTLRVMCWPDPSSEGNPYLRLLYDAARERGADVVGGRTPTMWRQSADVWHLHWPERYLNARSTARALGATAYVLAAIGLARVRGSAIVWTAHNLRAHEPRHARLERLFWAVFTRLVDGTIFMSDASREEAFMRFPALAKASSRVIPHGHYRDNYPNPPALIDARRRLEIDPDARLVVCFGQVRPYKNVPALLAAFKGVADPRARLLVAGACHDRELADRISTAAASDERVDLRLGYVPDEATPALVRSASLMCLPYVEPLNSGAAILSLSFGVPCLMTDAPASRELQGRVGGEWLRLFSGPLTTRILDDALHWARETRTTDAPDLQWCDWDTVADATLGFFSGIVHAPADGQRADELPQPFRSA